MWINGPLSWTTWNWFHFFLSKCVFAEVAELISSSEWNKSFPWTKKAFLEVPELAGTLSLHSFTHYYWAANTEKLPVWPANWEWSQALVWANSKADNKPPVCPSHCSAPLSAWTHFPKFIIQLWIIEHLASAQEPPTNDARFLTSLVITYFLHSRAEVQILRNFLGFFFCCPEWNIYVIANLTAEIKISLKTQLYRFVQIQQLCLQNTVALPHFKKKIKIAIICNNMLGWILQLKGLV